MSLMPTDVGAILRIEVPVIVLIGRHTLSVEEVRALSPGAILELPTTTDDDLEILINNQPIAMGQAVKVGENFGVRLTCVGNLRQRIHALGGRAAPRRRSASGRAVAGAMAEDPAALADEILAEG